MRPPSSGPRLVRGPGYGGGSDDSDFADTQSPAPRMRCRLTIHFIDPEGQPQVGELRMTNRAEKLRSRAKLLRRVIVMWLTIQRCELVSVQLHDDEVGADIPI